MTSRRSVIQPRAHHGRHSLTYDATWQSWQLLSSVYATLAIVGFLLLLDPLSGTLRYGAEATSEKRLISTLLENYKQNGIEGRPVLDTSRPLAVAVGFTLVQLLWYDDRERIVSLVGWLNLQWKDALLQWNASEYDNVHQVALYPRQIWTPDVVLVNAISPPKLIHEAKLIALNTGLVVWAVHVHYQATCGPPATNDFVDFSHLQQQQQQQQQQPFGVPSPSRLRPSTPFDLPSTASSQSTDCELHFGSWTLNTDLLQLQPISDRFDPQPPQLLSGSSSLLRGQLSSASSSSSTSFSSSTGGGGGLQLIQRTAEWDVLVPRFLTTSGRPAFEIQYPWRPGVRYSVIGYRMTLRRRRTQPAVTSGPERQRWRPRGVPGGNLNPNNEEVTDDGGFHSVQDDPSLTGRSWAAPGASGGPLSAVPSRRQQSPITPHRWNSQSTASRLARFTSTDRLITIVLSSKFLAAAFKI